MEQPIKKQVAILGATGSIGDSTLAVIAANPERYDVVGLSGHSRLDKLLDLCRKFSPRYVCVPDTAATDFAQQLQAAGLRVEVLAGDAGLIELASHDTVDTVVAAIVGAAGLPSTLAAANHGKTILLANKEALVMAGALMIRAAQASGARLLPIDSEHNAIFQCLPPAVQTERAAIHAPSHGIKRLWLTASGGPFLQHSYADMQAASVAQAVKHPNWSMGQKISVDSATMMNKGLELIEASFLFDMPVTQIDVVIHPQSIIHSMVEYSDGSVLAQLGTPDMRTPIAHALAYPDRIDSGVTPLDLFALSQLTFLRPDLEKFRCLALAYDAMQAGSAACIALNASNEVAVAAFLAEKIRLTDIARINETVLQQTPTNAVEDLAAILAVDEQARTYAKTAVKALA